MHPTIRRLVAAIACMLAAPEAQARSLILISIDGLRPAEIVEPRADGLQLPNLGAFLGQGSYARAVRNVTPTLTLPNHVSLITGASPEMHGIVDNLVFDPLRPNASQYYWYAQDIKVPTLWGRVKQSGGTIASVNWPVTVGAADIDYNIPLYWRDQNAEDVKLVRAMSTPGLVDELERRTGHPLALALMHTPEADRIAGQFAGEIIKTRHPRLLLINFSAFDHAQHLHGPDSTEAKLALQNVDRVVGDLIAQARAADPDAVIAVVSDHGFAPLREDVNLLQAFVDAGLASYDPKQARFQSWEAMPWGGSTASVYLARAQDADLQQRVGALLAKMQADNSYHIRSITDLTKDAAYAQGRLPAFRIGFEVGYEMGHNVLAPRNAPSRYLGMHGYPAEYPEMRSAFFIRGAGVPKARDLGEIDMKAIAPTLAATLGLNMPGKNLLSQR
jgi:predicted AlkP superfamily pyrophosphatase or phosphodiesterase